MPRFSRRFARGLVYAFAAIGLVVVLWVVLALTHWSMRFRDSVTLPNGMILKRELDFDKFERDDMFASDGRTLLSRDILGVCFNDRYVEVYSRDGHSGGLFDGVTGAEVPYKDHDAALAASGLNGRRLTCDGYFTGMLGPGLLYDGLSALPARLFLAQSREFDAQGPVVVRAALPGKIAGVRRWKKTGVKVDEPTRGPARSARAPRLPRRSRRRAQYLTN